MKDIEAQVSKQLEQAIALHRNGMLREANSIYHRILKANPQHPDALHLAGVAAYQANDYPCSVKMIKAAIGVDSRQGMFYINLGNSLQAAGKMEEAIEAFTAGLQLEPSISEGYYNLASVCKELKRYDEALIHYDLYIHRNPKHAQAHFSKGEILRARGRLSEAQASFEKGLAIEPGNFKAIFDLAVLHDIQNHLDHAIHFYMEAKRIHPKNPTVCTNLGNVYKRAGRFKEAMELYRAALESEPFHEHALSNLFDLMRKRGFIDQAVALMEAVLEHRPDWVVAHNLLGSHYIDQRNRALSEKHLLEAIKLDPKNANAYNLLGMLYSELGHSIDARQMLCKGIKYGSTAAINNLGKDLNSEGRHQAAISCTKKAIEALPKIPGIHSNLIYFMHYSDRYRAEEIFKETCHWWERHGKNLPKYAHNENEPSLIRPLRVGYISPDFRRHSVAYFFLPLIQCHDRNRFEIFCYSNVQKPDEVTDRISRLAAGWCSTVGLSDDIVAEQIRKDRIDILVDLAGHTGMNRLPVLARRPAPVQVTWLGYPNTTGVSTIDYRITDEIADPYPSADRMHTETLLRMPHGFLCFMPPQNAPDVQPLVNMKDHPIIFGSFNNLAKMNAKVLSLWMEILRCVPNSRLMLKSKVLRSSKICERYRKLFAMRGVDPERIVMHAMTPSVAEHLALYNQVTIGLDPMPYNGTTTTCEALFMGVPVITLAGDRHSARVGASILTRVGLTDLIAETEDDYVEKAVELALKPDALLQYRDKLRNRILDSDLCNAQQFTIQMERMLRKVWAQWRASDEGTSYNQ